MEPSSPTFPTSAPAARQRGPWRAILVLFLVIGTILGIVGYYAGPLGPGGAGGSSGALTYEVVRSPLQITIAADGNVESASNIEVKCRVAGGSTILWIVEDGKVVEEGEEIVKLDTSAIDDKLNSQRLVYEKALATQIQAQEDLEAAEISVKEYEEGTFVQSLQQIEAEIRIALENLRSAENQLVYSKRMVRKGFSSSLQREADEFAVERARLELDAANTRKKVLVEFTKLKTMKDLGAKHAAAKARLQSEDTGLKLEKARLDRLQDQLKNCIITAPARGMVVYANDSRGSSRFGSSGSSSTVEEGAMVRESQALVRLPDLAKMQVKVTIHESRIDQVRLGLPVRVVIQDQEYLGKVINVANQPQPGSWYSANVKEYATVVSIAGETSGLRPGMTARVTILLDDLKDALCLPVSAVVERKGKYFCWLKEARGTSRRELQLGRTNDKLIEVVDGVKQGDIVFRNPRAMLEEARESLPFEQQAEDTNFKGAEVPPPAVKPAPGPASVVPTSMPPATEVVAPLPSPRAEKSGKGSGRGFSDLLQFDKDGDKKVSREEAPEQMKDRFDRMDPNGDGFIDEAEISAMRKRFSEMKGRGAGEAGGEGRPREDDRAGGTE